MESALTSALVRSGRLVDLVYGEQTLDCPLGCWRLASGS